MIQVGAGKEPIKIADVLPLEQYVREADPIHIRCLLMDYGEKVLLLSLELPSIRNERLMAEMKELASRESGVSKTNIWICTTHNLTTIHIPPEDTHPNQYRILADSLKDALIRVCRQAVSSMGPVKVGVGRGTCEINTNRDVKSNQGWWNGLNGEGEIDNRLTVFRFQRLTGELAAVLYHYPVKSCVLQGGTYPDGTRLSTSEITGKSSQILEEKWDAPAIFLMGAAADLVPRTCICYAETDANGDLHEVNLGLEKGFVFRDELGAELAQQVIQTAEEVLCEEEVNIWQKHVAYTYPGQQFYDGGRPYHPTPNYIYKEGREQELSVEILSIADTVLLGMMPETTAAIGKKLKNYLAVAMVNGGKDYMADQLSYERFTFSGTHSVFAKGTAEQFVEDISQLLEDTKVKEQPFLCGAAKALITPPKELLPHFFGLMRSAFDGIHDDLYVRVIALKSGNEDMLLISFDLDKAPCPEEFTQRLEEETGISKENMLYFGIHAHAVPILGYRPFEPRNDITAKEPNVQAAVHAYEGIILEQLIHAAKEAISGQQAARYGYGYGKSYINRNRVKTYQIRHADGKEESYIGEGWSTEKGGTDPTVFLMRFEDQSGRPLAFLANYAMHNVAMFLNDNGAGKMAVSSDIGGTVSKYMEREYPGAVAVWSSGAAGDVNCLLSGTLSYPDPEMGSCQQVEIRKLEVTSAFMKCLAGIHFQDILDTNRQITALLSPAKLFMATKTCEIPYVKGVIKNPQNGIDPDKTYQIRLRLASIGEVAFMGVNGELYSRLGKAIQEASLRKHTVVITHDSSLLLNNPGYIYDDETVAAIRNSSGCGLPGWQEFAGADHMVLPALQSAVKELTAPEKFNHKGQSQ